MTAHLVAAELERALAAGPEVFRPILGALFADEVDLRHEPPLPADGIVGGTRLAAATEREAVAITGVLADRRYGDIDVTVDGDQVLVRTALMGTLPDGRAVVLPTRMRCTIAHGRISALTHEMGADALRAWAEVAVAGGLGSAEKLLD